MASTVWRGYVSFGLISIPVRLFRAARAERTSLRTLYRRADKRPQQELPVVQEELPVESDVERPSKTRSAPPEPVLEADLAPVRTRSLLANKEEVLPKESLVKGYEYEKDRFVVLEADELKAAIAQTSSTMQIEECVALSEIDPVYFETSYYVTPEEAGEKAYALLYRALLESKLVALAQFAMHGREHVVVLRAGKTGLLAHTMFFEDEVRHDEEFVTDLEGISDKELQLAQTLVQSLAVPFEPGKYRDTYRERIQALIEQKVNRVIPSAEAALPKPTKVVDIAEALRQSLAKLKKPPASTTEPSAPELKAKPRRTSRRQKAEGGA